MNTELALEENEKTIAEANGKKSGRQRLQLDFSPEAFGQLQQLRATADVKTNAEVVRNALRLYGWFLEQKKNNYRIQIAKDDSVKEVELIF
jgi:hypothetical protein